MRDFGPRPDKEISEKPAKTARYPRRARVSNSVHFFSGSDVLFVPGSDVAPGSNVQLAPPPAFWVISFGSIVQFRFDSDSKTDPAARSGGTPTSSIVA
jgi:hypothetical protein